MNKRIALVGVATVVTAAGMWPVSMATATPTSHSSHASHGSHATAATSHWLHQLMPRDGELSIVRNGTTPTAKGSYTISLRLTKNPYTNKFLVEAADGADLGKLVTMHSDDRSTATLAQRVPAGTQYNVICFQSGAHQKSYDIKGAVREERTR